MLLGTHTLENIYWDEEAEDGDGRYYDETSTVVVLVKDGFGYPKNPWSDERIAIEFIKFPLYLYF